jgi:hypothetical protein
MDAWDCNDGSASVVSLVLGRGSAGSAGSGLGLLTGLDRDGQQRWRSSLELEAGGARGYVRWMQNLGDVANIRWQLPNVKFTDPKIQKGSKDDRSIPSRHPRLPAHHPG